MAMNEYNNKRQYTKYKRHVDNAHEVVSANAVNKLQDDLSAQQIETNKVKDTAFEERVYTIFDNNLFTNAMFLDTLRTGEYVNMHASSGVVVNYEKSQVTLQPSVTSGTMSSTTVFSVHGPAIQLNDFFLIADEDIPLGAEIKYYLTSHQGERWPITPNALKTPMHLTNNLEYGFTVTIEFRANALGEAPKLNGYAVLYWDAKVEENYGMTNPDLQRFP